MPGTRRKVDHQLVKMIDGGSEVEGIPINCSTNSPEIFMQTDKQALEMVRAELYGHPTVERSGEVFEYRPGALVDPGKHLPLARKPIRKVFSIA